MDKELSNEYEASGTDEKYGKKEGDNEVDTKLEGKEDEKELRGKS